MSSSHEIEIKFKVDDVGSLTAKLQQLGFQQVTPRTHEMNTLFDLPGQPLRKRGDLLRLRKYGDVWVLTHKSKGKLKEGQHKIRVETETRLEDGLKMEAILRALQFEPSFRYEKFRAEWKRDEGHVVIDETPIGNFGEIEGPPEWIDAVASELGITPKDYLRENYAALFFEWKRQSRSAANEMTFAAVSASHGDK
jgi:adenylate cyclase, class 2